MAKDLVAGGLRNRDLERIYGMTPAQISIIVNSPIFRAEVRRLEDIVEDEIIDIRKEVKDLVPAAKRVLTEALVNSESLPLGSVKIRTALDVMKLAGGNGNDSDRGSHLHLHKHYEKHVHQMQDDELRDSVFDLIEE